MTSKIFFSFISFTSLYPSLCFLSYWCPISFNCSSHYHSSPSSLLPLHVKKFTSVLFFHSSIPSSHSLLSSLLLSYLFYLYILSSLSSSSFLPLLHIITTPSLLFFHSCVFLSSPILLPHCFPSPFICPSYYHSLPKCFVFVLVHSFWK